MSSAYVSLIGFDAARCAFIALISLGVGWPLGANLPKARWIAGLMVAPLLTPALLVSYAYAPLALRLTGQPALLLVGYSLLLTLKLTLLVALARWFFPTGLTREANFCAQLIAGRRVSDRLSFSIRSAGATPWVIVALAFLLAFTDFELASLLSVKTWPVVLFDAHAGGLELRESLARVALPLGLELTLIAGVMIALGKAPPLSRPAAAQRTRSGVSLWIVAASAMVTAFLPLAAVTTQAVRALPTVFATGVMLQEIVTSISFAIAGAGLAWVLASFADALRFGKLLLLPGLLGALVLALLLVALFQSIPLRWAYDTPAPLALALALLLAPVAFLLRRLLRINQPREELHLARMAGIRELLWDLAASRYVAALGLLFLLAYFEFTASTILAPTGFTPSFVRLHNLSHYGQTPILSLMLLAATLAPALLLALTLGLGRLYARPDAR
jgi:ABC-type Fe3+ transport system permease subunit